MRSLRTILLVALAAVLAVALAACGSSSSSSSSSSSAPSGASGSIPSGSITPATEPETGGKMGGTLNALQNEDFEHLDPGQAYFSLDYDILAATQSGLYAYKPNTFSEATPLLAEAQPTISDANKLITIKIRKGIHFSPPVNREVTAADEVYALERIANPNVANPYYLGYLESIEGMKAAKGGPIPGIKATDKYTVQIKLTESAGGDRRRLDGAALHGAGPEEYAKKFDAKKPSEYANYQVALVLTC